MNKHEKHEIAIVYILILLLLCLFLPNVMSVILLALFILFLGLVGGTIVYCKLQAQENNITFAESVQLIKDKLDDILKGYENKK